MGSLLGLQQPKSSGQARDSQRPRAPGSNSTAASARAYAGFFRSTHSYIQKIKSAMSYWLLGKQSELLDSGNIHGDVKHSIFQVAVDETEIHIKYNGEAGLHHLMMIHGKLFRRFADGRRVILHAHI